MPLRPVHCAEFGLFVAYNSGIWCGPRIRTLLQYIISDLYLALLWRFFNKHHKKDEFLRRDLKDDDD